MTKVVGIKFDNSSKIYYFAPKDNEKYDAGDGVIVETARGTEFATVGFGIKEVDDKDVVRPLKPILRKATKKDCENAEKNKARVPEAMKLAEEKVAKLGLKMKLVGCEFAFDGKKVVFYFTAEGRVDFRDLVKELASVFHTRIELRQIGIRDETKLLGGIAPCGRECCCSSCMPDFRKVSIKMAKTQGLSLNPGKISGLCGRLMCCLSYEDDYYSDAYKKMPKLGGTVETPDGKGIVVSNNMLKFEVSVRLENPDGSMAYKNYALKDVKFKNRQELPSNDDVSKEIKEILD